MKLAGKMESYDEEIIRGSKRDIWIPFLPTEKQPKECSFTWLVISN